jgi:hypothetical protein
MAKVTANYANSYGKTEVNMQQNINFRKTVRLVKDGKIVGERCSFCSGIQFKKGKLVPTLSSNFQHKKGCKLA